MTLAFRKPDGDQVYANILLYGGPKTGKSIGASSAPPGVLFLNLDLPNATRTARAMRPDGSLMEVEFQGFQTLVDTIHALNQQSGNGTDRVIETVVVDPLGELYRLLLEEASDRAVRPTLPQRGDVSIHIERFCRGLCEADVNVVLVAHEVTSKDEGTGLHERLPWTGTSNPALGSKLMGMVDIVGYTGVIEKEDGTKDYVAQLVNSQGRRGGDRFDVLGDWRTLDLTEWVGLARGANAHATEPLAEEPDPRPGSAHRAQTKKDNTKAKNNKAEAATAPQKEDEDHG